MSETIATVDEYEAKFNKHLTDAEKEQVKLLLIDASSLLRVEASNRGFNIDFIIARDDDKKNVAKMVVLASVKRVMQKLDERGAFEQVSESALGYSFSGTYVNPGEDIYFLNNELKRLGLTRNAQGFFIDLWQ
jgi:hypothetical protein